MFRLGGAPVNQVGEVVTYGVFQVADANPDKAEQAKAKPALAGWFVGQVMKASGGKANARLSNELLKEILAR